MKRNVENNKAECRDECSKQTISKVVVEVYVALDLRLTSLLENKDIFGDGGIESYRVKYNV